MKKIFRCSVYRITNLINGKIYIGSSVNSKGRLGFHFNRLRAGKHINVYLQNAFNLYGEENFKADILECQEKEFFSKEEVKIFIEQREQYYLDTLLFASENDNRFNELGYNIRRRAESNIGVKHNRPESKKRHSDAAIEIRRREKELGIKRKKLEFSEEYKQELSLKYGRPLLQFDLNGNFISRYDSRRKAEKETGLIGIVNNCKGRSTKCGDYIFIHEDEYKGNIEELARIARDTYQGPDGRRVEQLDKKTEEVIQEFRSIRQAAMSFDLKGGGNIGSACKGKLKTAYGYKWRFKKDLE